VLLSLGGAESRPQWPRAPVAARMRAGAQLRPQRYFWRHLSTSAAGRPPWAARLPTAALPCRYGAGVPTRGLSSSSASSFPRITSVSVGEVVSQLRKYTGVGAMQARKAWGASSALLGSSRAQALIKATSNTLDAALGQTVARYRAYLKKHMNKIIFAGSCCALYYVFRNLLDFLGSFLHTVESSFWYLFQFGSGLSALAVAFHVRGRFHLSAKHVHKIAESIVANSQDPVVAQKLGRKIRMAQKDMRIVTRSGGQLQLKWKSAEDHQREQQEAAKQARELAAAERVAAGAPLPPGAAAVAPGPPTGIAAVAVQARERVVRLQAAIKTLISQTGVGCEYKPERAHMVFPVEGTLGRAMVSVECVKHGLSGLNGSHTFRLLALDFSDNTYALLVGDEKRWAAELPARGYMNPPILTHCPRVHIFCEPCHLLRYTGGCFWQVQERGPGSAANADGDVAAESSRDRAGGRR
jgi:hypothetical protein